MTSFSECVSCLGTGVDGTHPCWACRGYGMIEDEPEDWYEDWDEWDHYEEDGPLDLEDQLENALERADVQHTPEQR